MKLSYAWLPMKQAAIAAMATAIFLAIIRSVGSPLHGVLIVLGIVLVIVVAYRLITGYWHPNDHPE